MSTPNVSDRAGAGGRRLPPGAVRFNLNLKLRLKLCSAGSAAAALAVLVLSGSAHAATTIPVAPTDMQSWGFVNDNHPASPPTGALVEGPAAPPLGTGSARLATADNTDGQLIGTVVYAGTSLSTISKLDYWSSQAGPTLAPALQFDIRYRLTDTAYGGRLVYEPYQNGTRVVGAGWQHWTGLTSGRWWASKTTAAGSAGLCPQSNPCTWAQVLANWPNAAMSGGILFKAGSGWGVFTGYVDAFTIGIGGFDTTYDFEATLPDTTPPVLSVPAVVSAQAPGLAGVPVTYSATALDAVDGPVAAACAPASGSLLPLGTTTVTCSAEDIAGNSASSTFPVTVTLAGFTVAPPAVSTVQVASFAWNSVAFSRFTCSLDGAAFAACSSPRTYNGLAAGLHALCVRATADVVAACRSWTIASPGKPVAAILASSVVGNVATVSFAASQLASRFTCSLDGAAYRTCSSTLTYRGLARGAHTVRVLATNFANDTSAAPATASFTVS